MNRVGHTQQGGRGEIQRSVNRCPVNLVGHTQQGGRDEIQRSVNRCPMNRVGHTQQGGRSEIQRLVNRVGHTQKGGRDEIQRPVNRVGHTQHGGRGRGAASTFLMEEAKRERRLHSFRPACAARQIELPSRQGACTSKTLLKTF